MQRQIIVVDASIALKWLLQEPLSDKGEALFHHAKLHRWRIVGPPLLAGEVTNAIYQRFRRNEITAERADTAVGDSAGLGVDVMSFPDLHERAFAFVREHRLANVYDSHYVVLARLGC